ncbi:MAG TPA: hypothetical protein VFS61_08545, partial [Anaerolineales bacterium]|nr:hypothetical protein [Anaerolineales bacterium]
TPASASFRIFTIWLSENLDFFMANAPGSILPRSVYFSLVLFYGRVTPRIAETRLTVASVLAGKMSVLLVGGKLC